MAQVIGIRSLLVVLVTPTAAACGWGESHKPPASFTIAVDAPAGLAGDTLTMTPDVGQAVFRVSMRRGRPEPPSPYPGRHQRRPEDSTTLKVTVAPAVSSSQALIGQVELPQRTRAWTP